MTKQQKITLSASRDIPFNKLLPSPSNVRHDTAGVSAEELGEDNVRAPAQDAEFVLYHGDNVQATGFLEHIKLPHYVDFQSELELVRKLRREAGADQTQEQEAVE